MGVRNIPGLRREKVDDFVAVSVRSVVLNGKSFVPPRVLNASVLGVTGFMPS